VHDEFCAPPISAQRNSGRAASTPPASVSWFLWLCVHMAARGDVVSVQLGSSQSQLTERCGGRGWGTVGAAVHLRR
jgi:hypothetical protein